MEPCIATQSRPMQAAQRYAIANVGYNLLGPRNIDDGIGQSERSCQKFDILKPKFCEEP